MAPLDAQPDWDAELLDREAEIIGEAPARRPRNAAIEQAEELAAALGRADRLASQMTVPFNPPLENLRRRWFLYAWISRHRRALLPNYRHRLRNAVACYRTLRAEGRA